MKMPQSVLVTLWALLFALSGVQGGKVLVFPLDGSHWVNMKVIIEKLHSRGHDLTVIRASNSWYIKEESPYYTSITIPNEGGFDEKFFSSFVGRMLEIRREGSSFWTQFLLELEIIYKFSDLHEDMIKIMTKIFEDEGMMKSIQDAKYDVILADPAVGGGAILAYRFNIPLIFNVRWTVHGEGHFAIAPSPLSYVPVPGAELTDKMTFSQRVQNVLCYIFTLFQAAVITGPHYKAFCQKYFGPDLDYFSLFQDADIWLMRNDFTFEFPRPTMPNVVYMGGFQCKPSKPLPDNLEKFVLSSGEHGVIIMSLGTIISQLPQDITEEIAAAFAQLPQKVIWRYTGPRPATLGNNTLLVDWMPQNDFLGHPKTRVFVAHGGTNGVQEAIYHGVPLLGLPLLFDQPDNLSRMWKKGAAKLVDIATLDRTVFLQALKEVLYNPSYRENIQRLSRLHRDQPMKPLDRAVFWIEYVMRHGGAPHLRTQSFRMSWVVYHSVDVILTLLGAMIIILFITVYVSRYFWHHVLFRKKIKHE
ncbi:UDP glucuronosyltransferase 5 family, polypeptide A1 [Colossoma macropomum]|uniref:UDP glucuronosyltransferase 5 family, polypeptide A1 n=1 Tax=Colossoma macropomum TaxID=42526 RepID=UPI0018655610|nr:UDP glucuronosyltransferase 5 family, polypeptide A1 [Colossoma macropomum]XP_036432089.1 UDP glucuronosyltransferase 5 family, polypeptide A1 [Colossoma macropomum]